MARVNTVAISCRVICLVLLCVAIACVGIGERMCMRLRITRYGNCIVSGRSLRDWSLRRDMEGQYFVFITSFIILVALIILIPLAFTTNKVAKIISITLGIFSILATATCFCVEAWYASGYNMLSKEFVDYMYIESWIAATIFYFIITALLIIDMVFTAKV